jgi:multidrug transporter EmrE-like cation transporter
MLGALPFLLLAIAFTVAGQVMMRRGMQFERRGGGLIGTLLQAARSPLAWLGSFGLAAAMLCWLKVLSRVEIALVYPIFIGSGIMGVMLASSLVLRERIGLRRWIGTGLMLLGVIAASLE